MANVKAKLSNKAVDKWLETAEDGNKFYDLDVTGLYLQKNANSVSYRYRLDVNGKRQRPKLPSCNYPTTTIAVARKVAKEWASKVAQGINPYEELKEQKLAAEREASSTLGAFVENFYKAKKAQDKAGEQAIQRLDKHFSHWYDRPLCSFSSGDISDWRLQNSDLMHSTVVRIYGELNSCFYYAVEKGFLKDNPIAKVKFKRPALTEEQRNRKASERRALEDQEIVAFFNALKLYREEVIERHPERASLRFVDFAEPWLLTMLYIGFRPGDINHLRWEEIDFHRRTIRRVIMKTEHQHSEPMIFDISQDLLEVLSEWHRQVGSPKSGYVFSSENTRYGECCQNTVRSKWVRIRDLAGLDSALEVRTLRHNFASQLVKSGVDLYTVSKLMAHNDIQTTIKYYVHDLPKPDGGTYADQFAEIIRSKRQA